MQDVKACKPLTIINCVFPAQSVDKIRAFVFSQGNTVELIIFVDQDLKHFLNDPAKLASKTSTYTLTEFR